jgi:ribosome modulation factor
VPSAVERKPREYSNGYMAFRNGTSVQSCPHPPLTLEAEAWKDGWNDAREDHHPNRL